MNTNEPAKSTKAFRVMLVDNNIAELSALEYVARTNDTVITIKKGGMSALKHLDDVGYKIDALITDLMMPYMDGINLTSQIRAHESTMADHKPMAIFWHTGYAYNKGVSTDPIEMAKEKFNVVKIFPKPSDPIALISEVKEILECQ